MKNGKRITAFILTFMLLLSLFTSCGSEESKNEDKSVMAEANMKADIAAIDSIEDALRLLRNYDEGSYECTARLKSSSESDGTESIDAGLKIYGDVEKDAMNASLELDLKTSELDISEKLENIFCIKDNKLYMNLDAVFSLLTNEKTDLGTFGLLMPETDSDEAEIYYSELVELTARFFSAVCEGLETEKSTGKYYVHIKGADDLKKAYGNALTWLESNKNDVVDLVYASKDYSNVVDVKKYASALIDEYYDDIVESVKLIASEFSENNSLGLVEMMLGSKESLKAQLENYIDEAYSQVDKSFDKSKLTKDIDDLLAEQKKQFDEGSDSLKEAYALLEKTDLTIGVELDGDAYTLSVSGKLPYEECMLDIDISAKYVQREVEIGRPANEKRLPEVVKYVLENREALAAAISSMSIGTLKNVKSY